MILVLFVSYSIIIWTIGYLSIMESLICLVYIYLFIIIMLFFIGIYHILWMFIFWDWLGIISYFCIHYWISKIRSGIKAVIYNKIGDILFIYIIGLYFDTFLLLFHGDMLVFYYYWIWFIIMGVYYDLIFMCVLVSGSILGIMYSKSAQLPFFSWIENAILAPTPISSLLHSSTMVISGVYIGLFFWLIMELLIMKIYLCWYFSIGFIICGCICVLMKGFIFSDIKSIIAYSTISQISYMFMILIILGIIVLYHILIHGIFKSMMFIICGSIIHGNFNFQSIYMIWYGNICMKIIIWLGIMVLCGGLSKEGIIYLYIVWLRLYWIICMIIGNSLLTVLYSMSIIMVIMEDRMIEWNGKMNWDSMEDGGIRVYVLVWYGGSNSIMDWIYNVMFWMGGLCIVGISGIDGGHSICGIVGDEWSIDGILLVVIMGVVMGVMMSGIIKYLYIYIYYNLFIGVYLWRMKGYNVGDRISNNGVEMDYKWLNDNMWNNRIVELKYGVECGYDHSNRIREKNKIKENKRIIEDSNRIKSENNEWLNGRKSNIMNEGKSNKRFISKNKVWGLIGYNVWGLNRWIEEYNEWRNNMMLNNGDKMGYSMEVWYRYGWWVGMGWWGCVGVLGVGVSVIEFSS